jgi:hypothetical protein
MSLEHMVSGNAATEWGLNEKRENANGPEETKSAVRENELENRLKNLERLAESVQGALGRESLSALGKVRALDVVSDLRVKTKASWKIFRVAKLLSEPARGSMLAQVRETVEELEEVVASQFGVEMT